jgi:hypothetical protein
VLISASKNALFLIISYFYSSTELEKAQNRFCLEARGWGKRVEVGAEGKNDPNNVYTCE